MRVLLLRAGALGDVLLLRRAIAALRASGHPVSLMTPDVGSVLIGPGPGDAGELLPWGGVETARLLGGDVVDGPVSAALRRADAVVAYTRSSDVAAALGTCASTLLVHDPTPPPGVHASRWLCEPLARLGVVEWPEPPALQFTPEEQQAAAGLVAALPEEFVAIHPGSGSRTKNWPAARFSQLAGRLARGRRWLLTLGPAEDASFWTHVPGALVARDLPLRVLGAALSRAGVFVGNDSGASHLAAASGAPTLALFGPTDPACWAPVGPRVRTLRASVLDSLDVDRVQEEARILLDLCDTKLL